MIKTKAKKEYSKSCGIFHTTELQIEHKRSEGRLEVYSVTSNTPCGFSCPLHFKATIKVSPAGEVRLDLVHLIVGGDQVNATHFATNSDLEFIGSEEFLKILQESRKPTASEPMAVEQMLVEPSASEQEFE